MLFKLPRRRGFQTDDGEGWITVYADLMSALLCMMVMMFSMANIDVEKFQIVTSAITKYLNKEETVPEEDTDMTSQERRLEALRMLTLLLDLGHPDELLQKLLKIAKDDEKLKDLKRVAQQHGIVGKEVPQVKAYSFEFTVPAEGLFRPQTVYLTSSGIDKFQVLGKSLLRILEDPKKHVEIVGHMDSGTIIGDDSSFSSIHMLSVGRAEAVSLVLQHVGIPARRISVLGRGASEPLFTDRTPTRKLIPEAARRNRRIVVRVVSAAERADGLGKESTDGK